MKTLFFSSSHQLLAVIGTVIFLFSASRIVSAADAPGAKDHPLLKRITGSTIVWYKASAFDEMNIPEEKVIMRSSDQGGLKIPKHEHVEGKRATIYYALPTDVSPLEAVRQYEGELKEQNFEVLWEGNSTDELGSYSDTFQEYAFPEVGETDALHYFHKLNNVSPRYAALKGKGPSGNDMYVTAYSFIVNDLLTSSKYFDKFAKFQKGQAVLRLDVLEAKNLDKRLSVVKAEEITNEVAKNGRIAIYGILFDTDKADIKPESKPSLEEMASAIKAAGAGKKFLIVGHTDNQGAYDYNQGLSARRAKAVTDVLARDFGIPTATVVPVGVGMAAPVATNADDAGRAKNRRVEIVAM